MRGTVDGLVLREVAVGESDKLITVLTAPYGKILISAKGVRSMKNKNLPVCRLFTYGNFEFYEKGGKRWLASGSVNDNFFGLNSDIESFALAAYIVEIAGEISGEGVAADELLRMTLNTLYAIQNKLKPMSLIKAAYELYAASLSGFEPDVSGCRECWEPFPDEAYLDVMNGAFVCQSCMSKSRAGQMGIPEVDKFEARNIFLPINAPVLAALRYLMSAPISRAFAFELRDEGDMLDLSRLGETYLQHHLERGFESLTFLKAVCDKI